ncbi:MAG: glutamine--fructose-6-phosphate transaminase (isomerizing), partial [Candidatus Moranbacteria bacterium]|nr:glutamine--fructose-6-phosphate transaminase (isomerizing) [Candidatus Moranbacteria bacterium]
MCGIVGYIGKKDAQRVLLEGLKRLEYRGYDSSGVVLMGNQGDLSEKKQSFLKVIKAVGKVVCLEEKLGKEKLSSHMGIAHTRWATHGKPSEKNAHPHQDDSGHVAIVHNGIIENYKELKEKLEKKGHIFVSETDSEVIAQLIGEKMKKLSFEDAFFSSLKELKGSYAIVAVSSKDPEKIIATRLSSPLVLGIGKEEYILASDASAIVEHTDRVVYLEDGEVIIIAPTRYSIRTQKKGEDIIRSAETLNWSKSEAEKQGYPHFMLKEIHEQPSVIDDALRGRLNEEEGDVRLGGLQSVQSRLHDIERIIIVSCGTSYHAGLVGEYMLEEYTGIPVEVEYASEFRYRKPLLNSKTAVLALSQSGETADTRAAIMEAKKKGALTLGIINVVGSTIARETDAGVYNHAGPEIAVASTKTFTSQLSLLVAFTIFLGRQR